MTTLIIDTPLAQTGLTRTRFASVEDLRQELDAVEEIGVLRELKP